jgi:hypothetical protein
MEVNGVATVFFKILAEAEDEVIDGAGSGVHVVTPNNL